MLNISWDLNAIIINAFCIYSYFHKAQKVLIITCKKIIYSCIKIGVITKIICLIDICAKFLKHLKISHARKKCSLKKRCSPTIVS